MNFAETQLGNFVSEGWFDTQLWIQKGPEIAKERVKDLDFLFLIGNPIGNLKEFLATIVIPRKS